MIQEGRVAAERIPAEIKRRRQWVTWKVEQRGGKPTKVPYAPRTGRRASSTDSLTWGAFEDALEALDRFDGVGFVFSSGDPYTGVDLDGCVDQETGKVEAWAARIVDALDSYTELSPSGTGLHVIVRGKPPAGGKRGRVEVYDSGRYFTVTGSVYSGRTEVSPETRTDVLARLHAEYVAAPRGSAEASNGTTGGEYATNSASELADGEVLDLCRSARNADKFARLYDLGDAAEYGGDDSSADLALLGVMSFYTQDPNQLDRLFRGSALCREKWTGRPDYRRRTIGRALSDVQETYTRLRGASRNGHHPSGEPDPGTGPGAGEADETWEDPTPLPDELPPVEPFDPSLLPDALRPWCEDIAERMQVPLDYVAVGTVAVAASLVGRRVGILPKRRDDWLVIPNLWAGIVGPPSAMKSPALAEITKPLDRLVAVAREAHEEALSDHETEAEAIEAEKAAMKKAIDAAAKKFVENGDRSRLDDLIERKRGMEAAEPPSERRYKTSDTTIEKLVEILRDNPSGVLVQRDELTGWLRGLDRQGREVDRAFYLESWNGTGSYTVDRIGRGTLHVEALCISILGGIQPGPLRSYVYGATRGGEGADGLLQRFQLLVWPDPPSGAWRNVDRYPDADAKNRAYAVYEALDGLDPKSHGVTGGDGDIPALRFSRDAQEVFDTWRHELEAKLRNGEGSEALVSHLAKYRSLMPSLALVFHLVDGVATETPPSVGIKAAARAAAWCEYLEGHAHRVYASGENSALEGARALLARIEKGVVKDGDTLRSISHGRHWSKLSTAEEVGAAAGMLEDYGWLRVEKTGTGGRPTEKLRLHPDLHGQREMGHDFEKRLHKTGAKGAEALR